jgi:solute carrier family 40 (iron-regulated transporter), member 1
MNSQMWYIDLFCKLISSLAIALIGGASTKIATQTILWTNVVSVAIEYALIARTYGARPALTSRIRAEDKVSIKNSAPKMTGRSKISGILSQLRQLLHSLKGYFRNPALLPSLSLSLLHLTALSFPGQILDSGRLDVDKLWTHPQR